MIVTFYSFKGGVGRSMALASVATLLARLRKRIIVVDCDLEAPGLESFFLSDSTEARAKPGFIDLVATFDSLIRSRPKPAADGPSIESGSVSELDAKIRFESALPYQRVGLLMQKWAGDSQSTEVPAAAAARPERGLAIGSEILRRYLQPIDLGGGAILELLSAGDRSDLRSYQSKIQGLSWRTLCTDYAGIEFIDWLRCALCDNADLVLVDSRTGLAEISGVCTHQLCDALILLSAPNPTGIDGCAQVAKSVLRYSQEARQVEGDNRYGYGSWGPRIACVTTRLPYEGEESAVGLQLAELFEEKVRSVLDPSTDGPRSEPSAADRTSPFWDISAKVPQVSRLSVGVKNVIREFLLSESNALHQGAGLDVAERDAITAYYKVAGAILAESEKIPRTARSSHAVSDAPPATEFRIWHSADAAAEARMLAEVVRRWRDFAPALDRVVFSGNLIGEVKLCQWKRNESFAPPDGPRIDVRLLSKDYLDYDCLIDPMVVAEMTSRRDSDVSRDTLCELIRASIVEMGQSGSAHGSKGADHALRGRAPIVFVGATGERPKISRVDPRATLHSGLLLSSGALTVLEELLWVGLDVGVRKVAKRLVVDTRVEQQQLVHLRTPTDTAGWSKARLLRELQSKMLTLGWANTTGSARKWWNAFIDENAARLALVYRLAEELSWREATITEFFLAYVYSNTDNIQANLHYLDYVRLKEKEEEKKKNSRQP